MNERDHFDELLLDVLTADAPHEAPDRLIPETQRALRDVRRRPRWLAYLKEPPMRLSSGDVVGSQTVPRLAFITLLAGYATWEPDPSWPAFLHGHPVPNP